MQMWKNFGGLGHWSCPVFLWAGGKAGCWLRCRRCSLSAPAPTSLHGESPFQAVGVFSELPAWDGFLEPVIGFVVTDSERVGSTLTWLFFSHFSCLTLGKSLLLCYRFTEPFGYAFFLLPWDSQLPLWYLSDAEVFRSEEGHDFDILLWWQDACFRRLSPASVGRKESVLVVLL